MHQRSLVYRQIFEQHVREQSNRPLFICDPYMIRHQYRRWNAHLPFVRPYYAVKCNPDRTLLATLAQLGSGFDCASRNEMEAVLRLGVSPHSIIFANPVKSVSDLRFAARHGVYKMTFDNEDELHKISNEHPEAQLVLRILPDDSGSLMRFGSKFGVHVSQMERLLRVSQRLHLRVVGTSFHIGSGCYDAYQFERAILQSRQVVDLAHAIGLPPFTWLDVGGGFPGNPVSYQETDQIPPFETFAQVIRQAVLRHFPTQEFPSLRVIAEPGRYVATSYATLFVQIQGKRLESDHIKYYINDGIYGSFNNVIFDHAHPYPLSLRSYFGEPLNGKRSGPRIRSTIFGPTCDSIDVVLKNVELEEFQVGDWLVYPLMGAYTTAAATTFNGIPRPSIRYRY